MKGGNNQTEKDMTKTEEGKEWKRERRRQISRAAESFKEFHAVLVFLFLSSFSFSAFYHCVVHFPLPFPSFLSKPQNHKQFEK